jgi:hypothetical protein
MLLKMPDDGLSLKTGVRRDEHEQTFDAQTVAVPRHIPHEQVSVRRAGFATQALTATRKMNVHVLTKPADR